MLSKNSTRRCHWVPQSYLKAFSSPEKNTHIWRFGKEEGNPELKRIDKVAVRFHLYAPLGADGKRNDRLERKFSELETFFGEAAWKDLCGNFVDLSSESMRKNLALIVATTWLRTPPQLENWKATHNKIRSLISRIDRVPEEIMIGDQRILVDPTTWAQYRDAGDEEIKTAWNRWLGEAWTIAEMLLDMRWSMVFSEKPVFITSDNPVMVGDVTRPWRGLKDPDILLAFPISPTRILYMDRRASEPDAQYYPLKRSPGFANLMTARNSIGHIFSSRHPDDVNVEILEACYGCGDESLSSDHLGVTPAP